MSFTEPLPPSNSRENNHEPTQSMLNRLSDGVAARIVQAVRPVADAFGVMYDGSGLAPGPEGKINKG
jgi:hypothetical protein